MEEDKEEHLEDLSLSDSESVMTGNIPYDSEESSSEDDNSKSDLGSIQRRSKFGWPRTSHSKRKDIESQTNKSGRESFQENQPTNQTDDSDEQEKRRIKPTRERRIITCLTLALCSICLLATLGIGILIGIATSKESGKNPTANESLTSEPSPSPTINQPTRSPTTDDLLGLLISKSFDEGASILTSGTPQRAAYEWLLQNSNLDGYSDGVKIARYALATLFYSTNGLSTWDEQIREGGWITDAPECEWASTATNQCTDGVYTSLTLDFVGVSGQIPQELGLLTGLKRLSLRSEGLGSPSVSGTLPDSIGELVDLETIRLNGNNIGGTLPSTVGQLTNIRVFLLSGNSLIGTIPSEIGNTGGNTYNFDGNQLSGKIPIELLTMQTLRSLNFDGNKLSGSIPTEIALNPSLNSLSLSGNKLVGRIPSEIGNLVTINAGIDLSNNQISGSLPTEIGFLGSMQNFQVQNNKLTGTVPSAYRTLSNIKLFRIDGNEISGEMPDDVCSAFTGRTISYSDCGGSSFLCTCCTFCCEGMECTCNTDDETKCVKSSLWTAGSKASLVAKKEAHRI